MSIRTAHIVLMTTAVIGGLAFVGHSASASLGGHAGGSWVTTGVALAATVGLAAYLRAYAARTSNQDQASDAQ